MSLTRVRFLSPAPSMDPMQEARELLKRDLGRRIARLERIAWACDTLGIPVWPRYRISSDGSWKLRTHQRAEFII